MELLVCQNLNGIEWLSLLGTLEKGGLEIRREGYPLR